jgi:hypothetical protein
MNALRPWPLAILLAAWLATPPEAAESMAGRWASDSAGCSASGAGAKAPLIVSDYSLRWGDEACRIGAQYRTGDTLHLDAFCRNGGHKRRIPISLRLAGDHIIVIWNRAPRGELWRCPRESRP